MEIDKYACEELNQVIDAFRGRVMTKAEEFAIRANREFIALEDVQRSYLLDFLTIGTEMLQHRMNDPEFMREVLEDCRKINHGCLEDEFKRIQPEGKKVPWLGSWFRRVR